MNKLVVRRSGQDDNHFNLDGEIIEDTDPHADLLAQNASIRHFYIYVKWPNRGEVNVGRLEAESMRGAHPESGDDPRGGGIRDGRREDVITERSYIDVLPEPGIVIESLETITPLHSELGQVERFFPLTCHLADHHIIRFGNSDSIEWPLCRFGSKSLASNDSNLSSQVFTLERRERDIRGEGSRQIL